MSDEQGTNSRETVRVELGERSYDIIVQAGVLADAGHHIAPVLRRPFVVVVTDENVAVHHLSALMGSLDRAGIEARSITLPAGEATKSYAQVQALCEQILGFGIDRSTTLVALGGGVIGDLVGFTASILLRGIDFVQVPTTLLSQVDSSVGGKTGINSQHGKNLVGAFHQPRLVLADVATLETLPDREVRAGYAEVIKYGAINKRDFFDWLTEHGPALLAGDRALRTQAVSVCCNAKAEIVAADEKEKGQRALLNLGHTFGHALELEAGYGGDLLHGEAVGMGMAMAFDLSAKMGLLSNNDDHGAMIRILRQSNLPVTAADQGFGHWDVDQLIAHMAKDKKVEAGKVTFILARAIGDAFATKDVPADLLHQTVSATVQGDLG